MGIVATFELDHRMKHGFQNASDLWANDNRMPLGPPLRTLTSEGRKTPRIGNHPHISYLYKNLK